MKARITGMSTWQGVPSAGRLTVYPDKRYADGNGNATVGRLDYVLDVPSQTWREAHNPVIDGTIVVKGADETGVVTAMFEEVFEYEGRSPVRQYFRLRLTASDLYATEFDYTQAQDVWSGTGLEPLTMQAARQLLDVVPELREVMDAVEGTLIQFAAQNAAVDAQLANLLTLSDLNVFYAGVAASAAQHQLLYGWSVQPVQAGGGLLISSDNETAALGIFVDDEGNITYTADPSRLNMGIDADGNITVEAI